MPRTTSMNHVTIDASTLERAYARSRATIQQLPVRNEDAVKPLERLLGTYEAVVDATRHHDAAVYVSAHEARRATGLPGRSERERSYAYPDRAGKLAQGIDLTRKTIAAYCERVGREAKRRLHDAPETITVGAKTYTLRDVVPASERPFMVGLDEQYGTIRKAIRQLSLYDSSTRTNPDGERLTETLLLCGPPGTGKSTLLKAAIAEGERCSAMNGTPFRFASYDASGFSSYFGQSTKILKKLLASTKAPDGFGLFVIEDADMVLQSRDDQHKSHGILELQQYLMNELSGIRSRIGNSLTILTTNKTEHIDEAMRSRMQSVLVINPFTDVATHEAYWTARAPTLAKDDIAALAKQSHAAGFAGRDLDGVLRTALQAATPEPTDDEIRSKTRLAPLLGPARADFDDAIAARIASRRN